MREQFNILGAIVSREDLWDSGNRAQETLLQYSKLKQAIESFQSLESEAMDLREMLALVEMDPGGTELMSDLEKATKNLQLQVSLKKTECLFSDPEDAAACFLTVQSGAGGTDSNDWAEMLLNMYTRWASTYKNFDVSLVDKLDGEEAGVKSATLKIEGKNAYGWCKMERGVHRLVRISPFNANAKRHTSFANISVSPAVEDETDDDIDKKDLRIETCRASGAGGQHINKTDSAVKITHIPTKTVVRCQNSRSQHRNKAEAMILLKSKLYELELVKKEAVISEARQNQDDIAWGHQIRSYVMQPYQLVKDLRTDHETSNIQAVLEGNLDQFITRALSQAANKKRESTPSKDK